MEGKLDLSWWQAKNTFDNTVEKNSISELLSFGNSRFREEQAYIIKPEVCKVVQVESTSLELIKTWQLTYREGTRPVLSWPCHCKFTISFGIHWEMLDGQGTDNLCALKMKNSCPESAVRHNTILSEYLCLQNPRFPRLVWALAQRLAAPAERLVSQTSSVFPSFTNKANKLYQLSQQILTSLILICQTFISKKWGAELERRPWVLCSWWQYNPAQLTMNCRNGFGDYTRPRHWQGTWIALDHRRKSARHLFQPSSRGTTYF